jgi:hypothetical protein
MKTLKLLLVSKIIQMQRRYVLKNKTLLSILEQRRFLKVMFSLETGTVHAIGAGMVVAEMQYIGNTYQPFMILTGWMLLET